MGRRVVALGSGVACWLGAYIVQITITKKTSAARNHRPESFPSPFFCSRDTAPTLNIFVGNAPRLGIDVCSGSHNKVAAGTSTKIRIGLVFA